MSRGKSQRLANNAGMVGVRRQALTSDAFKKIHLVNFNVVSRVAESVQRADDVGKSCWPAVIYSASGCSEGRQPRGAAMGDSSNLPTAGQNSRRSGIKARGRDARRHHERNREGSESLIGVGAASPLYAALALAAMRGGRERDPRSTLTELRLHMMVLRLPSAVSMRHWMGLIDVERQAGCGIGPSLKVTQLARHVKIRFRNLLASLGR